MTQGIGEASSTRQVDDRDFLIFDVHHRIACTIISHTSSTLLQTLEFYSDEALLHLQSTIGPHGGKYYEVLPFVLAAAANRGKSEEYLMEATAYFERSGLPPEDASINLALGVDRLQGYKKLPWFPSHMKASDWERVAGLLDLVHHTVEHIISECNTGASARETRRSIPLVWSGDLSSNRYDFEDQLIVQYIFEHPEDAALIGDLIVERKSSKWSVLGPLLGSSTPALSEGLL